MVMPGPDPVVDAGIAKTIFRVHYPAGTHTISLRGSESPVNWNSGVHMVQQASDTWEISLEVTSARVEWKPLLDDSTWSIGPNYVAKSGETVDIYPRFFTYNGRVTKLFDQFHSTHLQRDRGIWAYLPPSYDENTLMRFPVLYMHDGQNLFDPALAFGGNEWKVDETLNGAASDGTIRETIVIGVENTADRVWEYTGGPTPNAGGDEYRALLIDELKPRIDAMLRTLPDRANTGVMGSSMGGHISAYLAATRPDVFSLAGDVSPTVFGILLPTVAAVHDQSVRADRVYIDCGTVNDSQDRMEQLYQTYLQAGYVDGVSLKKVVQEGASHNEYWWATRLPAALQFLYGPRVSLPSQQ
jgi:predicted alpha/beta superfamily hydrolase